MVDIFTMTPAIAQTLPEQSDRTALNYNRPGLALAFQGLRHRTHLLHVPVQRIDQVVAHQAVMNELAALITANQARILENRQMLGDRRLGDFKSSRNLSGGQVSSWVSW